MDDEKLDARAWIAGIIGCQADELDMVQRGHGPRGRLYLYERAGAHAGSLVVAGPTRPLDGTAGGRVVLAFELPDKTVQQREVADSVDITF